MKAFAIDRRSAAWSTCAVARAASPEARGSRGCAGPDACGGAQSPRSLRCRRLARRHATSFPHIVGSDGAGVVEAVGSAASGIRAGDRVMINPGIVVRPMPRLPERRRVALLDASGSSASTGRAPRRSTSCVPAENLAPVPPTMPWAQAAAFSLATLTAWRHARHARGAPSAGETVLIWGIGGGVAIAVAPGRPAPRRARDRDQRLGRQARTRPAGSARPWRSTTPRPGCRRRGAPAHRGPRRGRGGGQRRARRPGRIRCARCAGVGGW